jgi:hypothetical protein
VIAVQVHLAAGDEEAAVNEVGDAPGQIAGEIRPVVRGAVAAQAAGDKDLRVAVGEGELHVGIGFVVAQQDVEAGLALLDEIIFERQGFVFVVDHDVVDIDGFAHERAGFGVGLRGFQQIGADARTEVFGFADVDHFAVGIFVQIDAGPGG